MKRSFCHFWDCIQVLHFRLSSWPWWLLHYFWGIPTRSSRSWSSELNSPIPVHLILLIPRMLTLTFAISCLTPSNLPWLPDFPGSYATLLFTASDLGSITSHIHSWVLFLLWLHSSFFLELFLHWSPVAYWAPTDLGSSSFSILSFCLFILFMGFSLQEYWSGLPFPSPGDHILSDHVWQFWL